MRLFDNGISTRDAPADATLSESRAATGLSRSLGVRWFFRSRFRRALGATFLAQVGALGIGALSGVLAARLLGPQGRGELTALTLWPMTLMCVVPVGINSALVFHAGKQRFGFPALWTAGTLIGLLQTVLVIFVGLVVLPPALHSYPVPAQHLALVFLGFAPVIILGGQPSSLLHGKLHFAAYNVLRTIAPAAYTLGLLGLFLSRRPYLRDIVACQIAGVVLAAGSGYALLCRKERLRWVWDTKAFKSLLSFGWKTQLSDVTVFVNQRADQLLLSVFVSPRQLGLYVVAVTVTSLVGVFPRAIGLVTYATGSNASPSDAGRIISRSLRASLLWLGAGCSLLFVIVPWLIPLAFGRDFAGSVWACRILLPGSVALGLSQVLYDGARALDQPALPSYAEGCSLIATAACLYVLVPRYGFVGAAVASTLAYTSSFVVTLLLFGSRLGLGWRELMGISTRRAAASAAS